MILWVKPPDIKNDTRKDACSLLLLSAPVKTVCFVSFGVVSHAAFCTPGHLLCRTTEPPGGPQKHIHAWTSDPISVGRIQNYPPTMPTTNPHPHPNPAFFFFFLYQLTFLSSSEMALEGQIRAGLSIKKKKSLLSLNLQVPNYTPQLSPISQTSEPLPKAQWTSKEC